MLIKFKKYIFVNISTNSLYGSVRIWTWKSSKLNPGRKAYFLEKYVGFLCTAWAVLNRTWNYSRVRNIDRPNIDRFLDFSRNFLKISFYLLKKYRQNKWTRRQNRWLLVIGIITTELVHSFYDVHELFLPRNFNLERLLGLKFFDFSFFESIVDNSYIQFIKYCCARYDTLLQFNIFLVLWISFLFCYQDFEIIAWPGINKAFKASRNFKKS